jgi:hypothetical protein
MANSNNQRNSIIDYRFLRGRRGYLGLRNKDLIAQTKTGSRTVAAFFAGDESMELQTIIKLASALGLKPRITFEVVDTEGAK